MRAPFDNEAAHVSFKIAAPDSQRAFAELQDTEAKVGTTLKEAGFVDAVIPTSSLTANQTLLARNLLLRGLQESPEFAKVGGQLVAGMFSGKTVIGFSESSYPTVRGVNTGAQVVIAVPVIKYAGEYVPLQRLDKAAEGVLAQFKRLSPAATPA